MKDLISRQEAIDALGEKPLAWMEGEYELGLQQQWEADIHALKTLPSVQRWIPVSERLPEDLEEVNITFTNLEPEPYYDFIKGKRFTGSAVFYKGDWYWYSSITVDVLTEYGRYESEKIDEGIKIIAWMSLPEPYKGEQA